MKQLKKITLALLFIISVTQLQAKDVPVTFQELPNKAQTFLKTYFPSLQTSYVIQDKGFFSTEYEVTLEDGTQLEFDENGDWKGVDGQHRSIPTAFIPAKIIKYVKAKFPNMTISKIEKDSRKYDIELNGDLDLEFNLKGDFLRMD
ncbi:hypothetical protein G7050_06750 [Dysgonomonas sp. HDW5A]|uniref:PepSY-like domain-containing protein n=1 Tax=Dysgonomonas sp. HDW5A TaxID=2714926 RepID=UPI00140A2246|nr:PepSY-like domain-containing protein [Dysgonomonas sp. HDW5A]QIK59544.1 hypothetical protein G7050_06750 [Dysgonomonas sp. HDW5A]